MFEQSSRSPSYRAARIYGCSGYGIIDWSEQPAAGVEGEAKVLRDSMKRADEIASRYAGGRSLEEVGAAARKRAR